MTGKIIRSGFEPAWWLPGAHAQTLWSHLCRRGRGINFQPERLELPDGDFVDLCWTRYSPGPIVAVFHGLEGNIDSPYASAVMAAIERAGWRGVLMHFRGCGGEINRLDRGYHSGDTGDIAYLAETLRRRVPDAPIFAVGYSLGGNALLKYLGEAGRRVPFAAAVAVSVPYLLEDCAARLSRGYSRLYQWRLVRSLRKKTRQKFNGRQAPFNERDLARIKTFHEFDEQITAPLHGFEGAGDYYEKCSSRQYLAGIRIPVLLLHARDDPFMTPAVIPKENELPDNVILELAERGGHVGFIGGRYPWKPEYWLERRITTYLGQYA